MTEKAKISRRDQILQCLVLMLEREPGSRITTAALAKSVGVSEAALYRHFPSKAKMFEGLINFIEETVFSRTKLIINANTGGVKQCEQILILVLTFVERNPGLARILTGDALQGESSRLHNSVNQFFERLETQIKQILREAELKEGLKTQATASVCANLMLACVEGRIRQYVRSEYKRKPTQQWPDQWPRLVAGIF